MGLNNKKSRDNTINEIIYGEMEEKKDYESYLREKANKKAKYKKYSGKFYDVEDDLVEYSKYYGCSYLLAIGPRGPGKTYSVKKRLLYRLKNEEGFKFVYLRRTIKQRANYRCRDLFEDIDKLCMDLFGDTITYDNNNGFYFKNDKDKKNIGYAVSIEEAMDVKGSPIYDKVKMVLLDEFVDYSYFQDEINRFLNIMETITRNREDVEVFMLANTVSKLCPYFDLFGFDVKKLRPGTITRVEHENGVKAALEYVRPINLKGTDRVKKKYVGFDNRNEFLMIAEGTWETKNLTTKEIDGISWNYKNRDLIPIYFSGCGSVFEISIITDTALPIAFVRRVNTQEGKVNENIVYNICLDRERLVNKNGIVPSLNKISRVFLGEGLYNILMLFIECVRSGRVIYSNAFDGTDFLTVFNEIIQR